MWLQELLLMITVISESQAKWSCILKFYDLGRPHVRVSSQVHPPHLYLRKVRKTFWCIVVQCEDGKRMGGSRKGDWRESNGVAVCVAVCV